MMSAKIYRTRVIDHDEGSGIAFVVLSIDRGKEGREDEQSKLTTSESTGVNIVV